LGRWLDLGELLSRQNLAYSALIDVEFSRDLVLSQIGMHTRHQLDLGSHCRRQLWATSLEHFSHSLAGLGQKLTIDRIVNTMFTIPL
jgi:hypothetical protein